MDRGCYVTALTDMGRLAGHFIRRQHNPRPRGGAAFVDLKDEITRTPLTKNGAGVLYIQGDLETIDGNYPFSITTK